MQLAQLKYPKNTKMVVLNHGDFWLNNILFKYSESGEIEDVKFQLTYFASPAVDLHYFLTASPCSDVRDEGTDMLIKQY
ncbi:hypothetical protein PR048_020085 [Dryococelus australis]|uniref:CHK kinase-like domain-containing protein n=1 Tax=Dryococelus australis TaxID=614101 RepID=A0ABQ9H5F6_9NEOP|nr:hypothetical protein PR048_020085 [Dryococelus australis]